MTWDAIIVGTGVGGSTLGLALAQAGKRVLFVEKGLDLWADDAQAIRGGTAEAQPGYRDFDEPARGHVLARSGRAQERLFNASGGGSVLPEIGCGTGGSSALFGMVLERFFPADFTPRAYHPDPGESSLPETWPLGYEDFRPWYEKAERLYRVRGDADPLQPDNRPALLPPASLGPGASALFNEVAATRLHPYRLHIACETLPDCRSCQGYLCPQACKNDADRMALRPAIREHGAAILSECRAVALTADRTRITGVVCDHRDGRITLRGRVVVLAAGALHTPALLLSSRSPEWQSGLANRSGLVGANLMRHGIDLWALLAASQITDARDFKSIGVNDLYLGTGGGKLGTVQSFGAWPPLESILNQRSSWWRLLGPIAPMLWRRLSVIPILASILEDLPYSANRVEVDESDGERRVRVHYAAGPSEIRRRKALRSELRSRLKSLGPFLVSGVDAPKALGHACGTCRFGDDPRSSVLDRNNKAHGLDNLFVVDASFFPSSAGMNPALTVAANALRVGALLASDLRA